MQHPVFKIHYLRNKVTPAPTAIKIWQRQGSLTNNWIILHIWKLSNASAVNNFWKQFYSIIVLSFLEFPCLDVYQVVYNRFKVCLKLLTGGSKIAHLFWSWDTVRGRKLEPQIKQNSFSMFAKYQCHKSHSSSMQGTLNKVSLKTSSVDYWCEKVRKHMCSWTWCHDMTENCR